MNKSYYAVIPANIRYDKRLITGAKLLYGEITTVCDDKGYCNISNCDFSKILGKTITSINRYLKQLNKCGYIETTFPKPIEIEYKLKKKNLNSFGIGDKKCSWCQIKTYILTEHHYPVLKKEGGNKTVSICPTCHDEYHYLMYYDRIIKLLNYEEINKIKKEIK